MLPGCTGIYDPNEAIAFWQRMSQAGGGNAPFELLSTPLSDETRIADIRKFFPEALNCYKEVSRNPMATVQL